MDDEYNTVTALLHQEIQRLQPCWQARNSTKDFKNKVSSISDSNLYIHHNFVYNLICKTNRSFLPPASSYGEKDHFTKTIFVSTSTTKVIFLQLSTYFFGSKNKSSRQSFGFLEIQTAGKATLEVRRVELENVYKYE